MPSTSEAVATKGLELAVLEPLLGLRALILGEAAVVGRHIFRSEEVRQVARHTFGEPPGIDENERRSVFTDQLVEPPIDVIPDLTRHHGFKRRIRNFQR